MTEFMTNAAYWDSRKGDYPFHAIQTDNITASFAKPEQLSTNRHGAFIRVPISTSTPPCVLWGFTRAADRDAFLSDFGGDVWLGSESS